ncbi:glycoside hydrolase family 28 protein [Neorhizobium galegae]|nr:glycoside hydrolase family 28 protein [Neorhizobium galegae]
MARIPLLGGAYQSRALIAAAQRSVNLYPERNPRESSPPVPVTHYLTPGLRKVSQSPTVGRVRSAYRATNGDLYLVVNTTVYFVGDDYAWTNLGSVPPGANPLSFADNGLVIVLVDGATGYAINMETRAFAQISDPIFYGATKVDYLDTYFVFNRPDTTQFYISLSNVTFDMLTGTLGGAYAGSIIAGGTGYISGTIPNVPFSGGSGTGLTANVTVTAGIVTAVVIASQGSGYEIGDFLSSTSSLIGAAGVTGGSITAPGSGYTNGSYPNVPLTGGTGTGAQATIVVTGGQVTTVTRTAQGSGYGIGNVLSAAAASIGGTGSGFTYTVSSVASGFSYRIDSIHGAAFDPLDIAAKTGSADNIVTIAVIHGELWLIGEPHLRDMGEHGSGGLHLRPHPGRLCRPRVRGSLFARPAGCVSLLGDAG